MAATTLTAADLLLIIVPLLAPTVGLFLHNNRLIHSTGRQLHKRIDGLGQEVKVELTVIRQEGKEERAEIRREGKEERAEFRQEVKGELTEIRGGIDRLGTNVARLGADVALVKGFVLGADAIRQSVIEQDVA